MAASDPVRKDKTEHQPDDESEPQGDTTDWKAEARKWEKRAKDARTEASTNTDAARRLKELEDEDKSELEKANRRADAADQRAEQAEARALRLEVAVDKGLTPTQAKRLVGKDRDELETDADELLEAFGGAAKGGDGGKPADAAGAAKPAATAGDGKPTDPLRRAPTEALRSGSVPEAQPEKTGKEIAAEIAKESEF